MRYIRIAGSFAVALFAAFATTPLAAQSSGTTTADLKGRVSDEKALALPGVSVTAVNKVTGATRTAVTLADGDYLIPLLPPGLYQVKAELSLFTPVTFDNVRLTLGSTTTLDIPMKLSTAAAAAVTVTAETPLLDATKTDLAASVDSDRIEKLPNVARNFLSFSLTTPRVSEDRGPQSGAAGTSGFSINGQSPRLNNVAVDGFDNNDQAAGAVRATFSQEAVQEYQVITNPYAAEFGRTSGGVINIITRSGTNDFKGSAFYYYRSDALAAEDPLTGKKVDLTDHRFGASLGGALVKDKAHFFGAFERQSTDTENPVTIADADVALIRSQGFSIENGNVPYEVRGTNALVKVDAALSPAVFLTARGNWSKGKDENQQQWGGLVAKSAGGVRDSRDTTGALGLTALFGSGSFNEFRALYSDASYRVDPLDAGYGVSVSLPGVATFGTQRFLPQPRDTKVLQLFDAFSVTLGAKGHVQLKVGAEYNRFELEGALPNFFAGLYRFAALGPIPGLAPNGLTVRQAFGGGVPAVFIQAFGDPNGTATTQQAAGFVQGDFTVTDRLLLRLGVRYDYEDPADPFPSDSDNIAPRASFSFSATDALRIKGGYGRFYGVSAVGPMFAVNIQNGVQVRTYLRVLGTPATNPTLWPTVPWRLPNRRFATEPSASVVPLFKLREGSFESAQSDQANLGVEYEVGKKLLVSADAVYARGENILQARNINPIVPGTPGPNPRPDPTSGDIFNYESTGNSWYLGGTLGFVSRFSGPFNFNAYYTYAKAEDDYIDWLTEFQAQDPLNPKDERAPTVQSPDQKLILTGIFSTVGRGSNWLTRDWTFATIVDWRNGLRYNVLAGVDRNQNGDPASDRPAGVRRNAGQLGSQFSLDLRVSRTIPLAGGVSAEVIAVCTNVTNNENVLARQNVANQPGFGNPTLVGPGRVFQIGGRVAW